LRVEYIVCREKMSLACREGKVIVSREKKCIMCRGKVSFLQREKGHVAGRVDCIPCREVKKRMAFTEKKCTACRGGRVLVIEKKCLTGLKKCST